MPSPALSHLGSIVKTHGLKGACKLKVEFPELLSGELPDVLWLDVSQPPIPYFVKQLDYHFQQPDRAIITFDEVTDIDEAARLIGTSVSVESTGIEEEPVIDFSSLIGYHLIDEAKGDLGPVNDVMEMPNQILAQLFIENKEVLVPLNEQFITELNPDTKTVHVQLPEGLLDVYLED